MAGRVRNAPISENRTQCRPAGTRTVRRSGRQRRRSSRVRKQGTQAGDASRGRKQGTPSRGRKQGTPSRGRKQGTQQETQAGDAAAGTHRDAAAGTHKGTHSRAGDAQQGTQPGTGDAASARHLQRDGPCWKLALRGLGVLGVLGLIEAGTLPTSLSASRAGHPSGSPPASVGAAHPRGSELDVQGQRFGQSIKVAPRGCDAVGTDGEDL